VTTCTLVESAALAVASALWHPAESASTAAVNIANRIFDFLIFLLPVLKISL
jgi:hypothetical protein